MFSDRTSDFLNLPAEIKLLICTYLKISDLTNLFRTNSYLKQLSENNLLWKNIFQKEFPEAFSNLCTMQNVNWYEKLKERFALPSITNIEEILQQGESRIKQNLEKLSSNLFRYFPTIQNHSEALAKSFTNKIRQAVSGARTFDQWFEALLQCSVLEESNVNNNKLTHITLTKVAEYIFSRLYKNHKFSLALSDLQHKKNYLEKKINPCELYFNRLKAFEIGIEFEKVSKPLRFLESLILEHEEEQSVQHVQNLASP